MTKTVLIVENDATLSRAMKEKLTGRGFEVSETSDGKGCSELIRRSKPDAVVLAVDLAAGQNGYIICKKLKSDDELKSVPVVIIGNPDGFAQHKKLKTHADDYLGKPFDPSAVVDRLGTLIGWPVAPPPPAPDESADEGLSLSELLEDPTSTAPVGEEIRIETHEETVGGDPDLDMVDAVFDDGAPPPVPTETSELESSEIQVEDDLNDRTVVGVMPPAPPPPPPSSAPPVIAPPPPGKGDAAEVRSLRAKVTELTGAVNDARARSAELESKASSLESELASTKASLETARSSSGKSDSKEVFSLREQATKKDKEILRLKQELTSKESEIVELQEKQNSLDLQASESSDELANRDAQIKTLTAKSEQLASEKKKADQQLTAAKDEARSANAQLGEVQSDLEASQSKVTELEGELESTRSQVSALETQKASAEGDLADVRQTLEQTQADLASTKTELEDVQGQLSAQAATFAQEISSLRQKLSELETASQQAQGRLKAEQDQRVRAKQAFSEALALLEAPSAGDDVEQISLDDVAEA